MSGTVTKITFPPGAEPGLHVIRVYFDGKLSGPAHFVGDAVKGKANWHATLWSREGESARGDEEVHVGTLRHLRAALLDRLERDGPWWQ